MELVLFRTYHPEGTNGELYCGGKRLCYTIELPWKDNGRQCSCIPEGRYTLSRRNSKKLGRHLLLAAVPGRSLILFHPANDARTELRGCIAPVSSLTGPGQGLRSRSAFRLLLALVYDALEDQQVYLTIKTKQHEPYKQDTGAHA